MLQSQDRISSSLETSVFVLKSQEGPHEAHPHYGRPVPLLKSADGGHSPHLQMTFSATPGFMFD